VRSERLLVGLGCALALVACEQIIGLDNLHKCGAEIDCGVSDASDASVDASDAGDASDAFTFPDGVSEASSWARWRMDNTVLEVQSGAPDASETTFNASVPNELGDNVSGLVWFTQVSTANDVTSAASYCAQHGYRLPTRIEIVTLLDSTQPLPALQVTPKIAQAITTADAGVKMLWTSSYVRPFNGTILEFWFADLNAGNLIQSTAGNVGVLCVR
jgi:putative hemolysin